MENKTLKEQPIIIALTQVGRSLVADHLAVSGKAPHRLRSHEGYSRADIERLDNVAKKNGSPSGMPRRGEWWTDPEWRAVLAGAGAVLDKLE